MSPTCNPQDMTKALTPYLSYNAQNQLTSGSGSGNNVAFVYDGLGRCVKRTINGNTTVSSYDGWKVMTEWDGNGNFQAYNIHGPGADEILWRYQWGYNLRYHTDKQGNVAFLLDWYGNALERYSYDAFGTPTVTNWDGSGARTWSNFGNRFMFTGREYFAEMGIYDYRHRWYHPALGRFLQTDPSGFEAGDMNLFRYCGDDPVDGSDPTGLIDTSASIWNHAKWFEGGSSLSFGQFDKLQQGPAYLAQPTGNYKDSVEHHVATKSELKSNENGATTLNLDKMEEINGILIITPKLDWYVRSGFTKTDVVTRELQHVSRYLYWLGEGDGGAAIRSYNRHPTGFDGLRKTIKKEADDERWFQWNNMDGPASGYRHSVDKHRAQEMKPADIQKAIENVQPREEPWLER